MINHSQPPGHNRDYSSRPRQSDRLRSDYGNTRLTPLEPDARPWKPFRAILGVAMIIAGLYTLAVLGH